MKKSEVITKLKELKPFLQNEYYVTKIGLFGSYADNTFSKDSDINLLIELEKPIGWKFFSLEIYLEKKLGKKSIL